MSVSLSGCTGQTSHNTVLFHYRLICTQIPGRGGLQMGICMYRRLDTVVAP